MTRPGVDVSVVDFAPPPSAPTDTGVLFLIGKTESGPNAPTLVRSMKTYETQFGERAGFTETYDAADVYFREGGSTLYVQRYGGGGALMSFTPDDVPDGTVSEVLEWVGDDPARATAARDAEQDAATPRATLMNELNATAGDGPGVTLYTDPGPATAVSDALDRLESALGPGQVIVVGTDATSSQADLIDHAASHNRIALMDGVGDTATELEAEADALRSADKGRFAAFFAPPAVVPGTAVGTQRQVPFSVIAAGLMARVDEVGNPNIAAAGVNGQAEFATDLLARYTDAEYEALNEAGVNMARLLYGAVRLYGYRTLTDTAAAPQWSALNHSRLTMGIVAEAEAVGQEYVFAQIDGKRQKIAEFGSQLSGVLNRYYTAGALYGDEAADAYSVDVGPQVNTEETIAAGELRAALRVRMSPLAEHVLIEIVKVPSTEVLPTAA